MKIVFYGEKADGARVETLSEERTFGIVALAELRVTGAPHTPGEMPILRAVLAAWAASEKHRRHGPQSIIYAISVNGGLASGALSGVEAQDLARRIELFVMKCAHCGAAKLRWEWVE